MSRFGWLWGWAKQHHMWFVIAALALGLGIVGAVVWDLLEERDETRQALERARERSAERAASLQVLEDRLERLGASPRITDEEFLEAFRGPPPTREQIEDAVADYLKRNPPRAGRAPTETEIFSAVRAFCATGRCEGPPGPPPPQELVELTVAIFCDTDDACRGEPGPSGPQGPPGQDGEGQDGVDGQDGADGADGQDGADGADGRDGRDGVDGQDGTDGQDGDDGQPPLSWTFQLNNRTYTCQRVDDFDPDTPRYNCTQSDGPGGPR